MIQILDFLPWNGERRRKDSIKEKARDGIA